MSISLELLWAQSTQPAGKRRPDQGCKCSIHPSVGMLKEQAPSPVEGLAITEAAGGYRISAIDKNKRPLPGGNIVFLDSDRQGIGLYHGINPELGFQLDPKGRIIIDENGDEDGPIKFTMRVPAFPTSTGEGDEDWSLAMDNYKGALRLIAVNKRDCRVKDGNMLKFKADGSLYLYHTLNPILGLPTDREGRLIEYWP